jgi:hypothetical protein
VSGNWRANDSRKRRTEEPARLTAGAASRSGNGSLPLFRLYLRFSKKRLSQGRV